VTSCCEGEAGSWPRRKSIPRNPTSARSDKMPAPVLVVVVRVCSGFGRGCHRPAPAGCSTRRMIFLRQSATSACRPDWAATRSFSISFFAVWTCACAVLRASFTALARACKAACLRASCARKTDVRALAASAHIRPYVLRRRRYRTRFFHRAFRPGAPLFEHALQRLVHDRRVKRVKQHQKNHRRYRAEQ